MTDRDAALAGEDDAVRAEEMPPESGEEASAEACDPADGTCEIEHEGQTYEVPRALQGAFLRHADYTRKTQELAHHRRALEAERAAVAQQAQAVAGASQARVHLAALDHQLAGFRGVDWKAYAQQDPQGAQALWRRVQGLAQARGHAAQAVTQHEHGQRLQAEREAAEAMAETGRVLAREIPGWSPELASKLSDYAISQGVTLEELKAASDPRIWKVLHKAFRAEHGARGDAAAEAPVVRPAVQVSGAATAGGVRDELATKEWMRRRNDQLQKGR
ncbi:MAG: hypothetical protein E7812_07820 [Phenylobacterium sp.]|nr:MAG: hypothetical protein E7812_07820 [Phenylobacterium sp.]